MRFFLLLSLVFLAGAASANFVFAEEKIDINTAPLEDLLKIIHIGEARARELISLRPFFSLDELTKIRGIGEARVKDIKEQGLAWVAEPEKPKPKLADNWSPQALQTIELTKGSSGYPILLAALFTSFSGGVMILLLKKYVRT